MGGGEPIAASELHKLCELFVYSGHACEHYTLLMHYKSIESSSLITNACRITYVRKKLMKLLITCSLICVLTSFFFSFWLYLNIIHQTNRKFMYECE